MKENNFTIEQLEKIIDEAPPGAEFYTPYYAAEYRKITGRNVYYGFVDNEWMEVVDKSLSIERINKGFNLSKLQKQLEEMKMKESTQETRMTVKEFLDSGRKFHVGDVINFFNNVEWTIPDEWLESCNAKGINDSLTFVISAKELQPEFNNTAQQVESLGKETAYDEGMRNCVKDIAKIIGLNFPVDVGYANLVDEVDLFIDKIDGRMGNSDRDKLIKALGYMDHHLSIDGLIDLVAEMREELNDRVLSNSSEWNGEGLPPVGVECEYYCANPRMVDLMQHHERLMDCVAHVGINGNLAVLVSKDLSFSTVCNDAWIRQSLTPEQKQQKIDEQNGELYYKLICKVRGDELNLSKLGYQLINEVMRKEYIEIAKLVSFKGKLESI